MKLDHDKLDLLRARNVLTISQLAKVAKVSAATIVRGGNPGIVTVGKIAKALGVD
ncbi:XRE family transcriptional regulator, partial [Neglecta sp. X4]|nr:XRE family transcriptional regulator [Neglectibacter sp. X4]